MKPGTSRFRLFDHLVEDTGTGLCWPQYAQPSVTGLSWSEAFGFIHDLNSDGFLGHSDWRLPNRRELYSLIDHATKEPCLPPGNPFRDVWNGWYWTSTTSALYTDYAWRVQFTGGRMFYGSKVEDSLVWPVRGEATNLFATGQTACFDVGGKEIACSEDGPAWGQDGALCKGVPWPVPRWRHTDADARTVIDAMTGLIWCKQTDLADGPVDAVQAVRVVDEFARRTGLPWRLPTIMELESLTDCSRAAPALPFRHPFTHVRDAYWSATQSGYDPAWSFCLYLHKGAVGVGHNLSPSFHVWPVRSSRE